MLRRLASGRSRAGRRVAAAGSAGAVQGGRTAAAQAGAAQAGAAQVAGARVVVVARWARPPGAARAAHASVRWVGPGWRGGAADGSAARVGERRADARRGAPGDAAGSSPAQLCLIARPVRRISWSKFEDTSVTVMDSEPPTMI